MKIVYSLTSLYSSFERSFEDVLKQKKNHVWFSFTRNVLLRENKQN